jgi:signal peptidase I
VVLALLAAVPAVPLIGLVITRQVRSYSVPTAAMAPAIQAGDHVVMEHLTYWRHSPQRGDIAVFATDKIPRLGRQTYVKRLVGLPGETLRLNNGALYVNGERISLRNKAGEINYVFLPSFSKYLRNAKDTVTVPPGCYFVLGDNSERSADSRMWGFVPAASVVGRIVWCYWPIQNAGGVE